MSIAKKNCMNTSTLSAYHLCLLIFCSKSQMLLKKLSAPCVQNQLLCFWFRKLSDLNFTVVVWDKKLQHRLAIRLSSEIWKRTTSCDSFLVENVKWLRQALFLCNICVVFRPVMPFGKLHFIHASTNATDDHKYSPLPSADLDSSEVLISFSALS